MINVSRKMIKLPPINRCIGLKCIMKKVETKIGETTD